MKTVSFMPSCVCVKIIVSNVDNETSILSFFNILVAIMNYKNSLLRIDDL
jgi:hypothetical protein